MLKFGWMIWPNIMGGLLHQKQNKEKKPVFGNPPSPKKIPSYLGSPNIENRYLAWRFSSADINGPYSCGSFNLMDHQLLWDKLRSFENMNIAELRNQGSYHPIEPWKTEREAKNRLQVLQLDDLTMLHSFRIQGKLRLWCMLHENIMSILWWDRKHAVCPSLKKHT